MSYDDLKRLDCFFVIIYLLSSLGMAATFLVSDDVGNMSFGSSIGFVLLWVFLYLYTGIRILLGTRISWKEAYKNEIILIVFGLFIISSAGWSVLFKQSFTYSVSVFANFIFIIFVYRVLSLEEFLKITQYSLNFMILIGVILGFLNYEKAIYIDPLQRDNVFGTALIKGVFSHKIYSGVYSTLATILNLAFMKGKARIFWALLTSFSVIVSGSATGVVVFVIALLIYTFSIYFKTVRLPKGFTLIISFVFIIGALTIYFSLPYIFELLGRDQNMTGRGYLWEWAFKFWLKEPFFGWGYLGIFGEYYNAPSNIINDSSFYFAPHFHSAYFQILAELGVVGFVIYITAIACSAKQFWGLWLQHMKVEYLVAFVGIFIIAISGVVVNVGLKYNEFSTIFLFYLCLSVFNGERSLHKNNSTR
jgi:O-antigen ligase